MVISFSFRCPGQKNLGVILDPSPSYHIHPSADSVGPIFKIYLESDHSSSSAVSNLLLRHHRVSPGLWQQHANGPSVSAVVPSIVCSPYKSQSDSSVGLKSPTWYSFFFLCGLVSYYCSSFHSHQSRHTGFCVEYTKHTSASGPLHLLFPLPRMLSPQLSWAC